MADWKQITARIRRARNSKEPVAQLSNLFEKTRDAMVAFELAKYFESTGASADAAKWYGSAAERFRRADWKVKAQEAAVRLGGTGAGLAGGEEAAEVGAVAPAGATSEVEEARLESANAGAESDSPAEVPEPSDAVVAIKAENSGAEGGDLRHRRRGRRGGRNRRKATTGTSGKDSAGAGAARTGTSTAPRRGGFGKPEQMNAVSEGAGDTEVPRGSQTIAPDVPSEISAEAGVPGVKGRYGDPGVSSRLSLLEMQFRRLMTCAPVRVDGADHAPVGPGVFVLTDSDLTSYYYVEACQTLRIAVGNLLRGGASRRGVESIKPQLAEHLGIPETRVAKYLADHCVVRWLQLDEGASHFAHYVIAVLRPSLNE